MYDLAGAVTGFMIFCGLAGAAIMGLLFWCVPWLWNMAKPWLHAITE